MELQVSLIEGWVLEQVEETPHRDVLRETHGADVVIVVRLPKVALEGVSEETTSDTVASLDDLERDAEVQEDERSVQTRCAYDVRNVRTGFGRM